MLRQHRISFVAVPTWAARASTGAWAGRLLTRAAIALTLAVGAMTVAGPISDAQAAEFRVAGLRLLDPKAMPNRPGTKSSAAYVTIVNRGPSPDRLVRASTPAAASVEIHTMRMDGDVMKMREIDGIDIPSGQTVPMGAASADGYHLMLLGLRQPLKLGDTFPLALEFQHAGRTEVTVVVAADARGTPAAGGAMGHGSHGASGHGAGAHGPAGSGHKH